MPKISKTPTFESQMTFFLPLLYPKERFAEKTERKATFRRPSPFSIVN